ncbi:uncharacterized protein LOC131882534 isoform X1 [Tigriopus californicus]|uniref:uncharacterized protein LOC131882534 isoform X1 n=2 Tax=Tigriopus californicus TaxID=6832 RepID=UPI0027DA6FAE|nr:uncharacterized protein LOC131882534 isoform X1 [Tigriopus californicus]
MVSSCAVPRCKVSEGEAAFKFPQDPTLRRQWCVAIKRQNKYRRLWTPSSEHYRVCQKHFLPESIGVKSLFGQERKYLLAGSIPCLNIPGRNTSMTRTEPSRRHIRYVQRAKHRTPKQNQDKTQPVRKTAEYHVNRDLFLGTDNMPTSSSTAISSAQALRTSTAMTTENSPRVSTYTIGVARPTISSVSSMVNVGGRSMVLSSGLRGAPMSISLAKSTGPNARYQTQPQITLAPKITKPTFGVTGQERELALNNFEEFDCHGIAVFIHKGPSLSVYMSCPVCKVMCTKSSLSWHLQRAHGVAYIACSGVHCVNFRCKIEEYSAHIAQEHSQAVCEVCEVDFHVDDYAQHIVRHDLHARTDTILMPKALQAKMKLRPPLSIDSNAFSQLNMEYVNINFRSRPRPAAILLHGDIVLIDGIKYLIKDFIPFLECPICDKLVAIHVLGVHVKVDHDIEKIRCPAQVCRVPLETDESLLTHLMSEHGAFTCKSCQRLVFLHEVKTHVKSKCQMIPQTRAVPKAITANRWAGKNENNRLMVKCEYCLIDIPETKYRPHMQNNHMPRITCGICHEVYKRNEFWAHIQNDHKGRTSVGEGCIICGESVPKMRDHLRVEHDLSLEAAKIVTKNFYGASVKSLSIRLNRVNEMTK